MAPYLSDTMSLSGLSATRSRGKRPPAGRGLVKRSGELNGEQRCRIA